MLGLCIRRLNTRVEELRKEMDADAPQVEACLSRGYAFTLKDNDLAYQLLLDMDSFIFETRSLYEIVGKFLVALFELLFDRKMIEDEVQSLLSTQGIDTRWIGELRDARKLFFHETAPWLAVQVERETNRFAPVLLKRQPITFEDSTDLVEFAALREIYEGFVNSVTELHRYIKEQIRLAETAAPNEFPRPADSNLLENIDPFSVPFGASHRPPSMGEDIIVGRRFGQTEEEWTPKRTPKEVSD